MHKVTSLLFLLSFLCCVLGQKYVVQKDSSYEAHGKEEGNHYESNHYEYEHKPFPYRFGYDIKDEKGNIQYHKEEGDEYNVKKGSYGFTDAHGVYREVEYIADHLGFRAKIKTNEPGTANYHPAHVVIYAEPPPSHVYANYEKYNHVGYQHPEHTSYQQPEHTSYQEAEHASYQQPEHSSYQQPEHGSYQQPQHSSYQQAEHAPYQQVEHEPYQQPEYPIHGQQFEKSVQAPYVDSEPKDLIKSEQSNPSKYQKYKHEESRPKLNHRKVTYIPVYVTNKIDYKH